MIHSEPHNKLLKAIHNVVLRLGGMHMQMSFLGCICFVLKQSILNEVLENIYVSDTIKQMMMGKFVLRAVPGHMIVYCSTNLKLVYFLQPAIPDSSFLNIVVN